MAEDTQKPTESPGWRWSAKRFRAATLLAEDELTDNEIAAEVDVCRDTINAWKRVPEFTACIAKLAAEFGERAGRYAIARKTRRIAALDDRWGRMLEVIEERAASPEMEDVPGGRTGLLVRTERSVGSGPAQQIVEEFTVDTGLLRELREHEKQAAQEMGQWIEKQELTGKGGTPIAFIEVPAPQSPLAPELPFIEIAADAVSAADRAGVP